MATYTWKGNTINLNKGSGWYKFYLTKPKKVAVGDTYLSTTYGHVSKCIKIGTKKEKQGKKTVDVPTGWTQWQYVRTDVIAKPDTTPCKLACPVRLTVSGGTRYMKATWDHYKWPLDSKNGKRAEGIKYQWIFDVVGPKNPYRVFAHGNESQKQSQVNLSNFKIGNKTYTRQSFYPNTKTYLWGMKFRVKYTNSKGEGAWVEQYRKFGKPRKPTLSGMSFNSNNGKCSITINTNAGTDYYERQDTVIKVKIYSTLSKKYVYNKTITTTNTSYTFTWDAQNYNKFNGGDYYRIEMSAYARGYCGNSDKVSKNYWVALPNIPAVKSYSLSSKGSGGHVTVWIDNKVTGNHPISGVRLQYLTNSEASKAADIPKNAQWQDFEVQDDGNCKSLSIPVNTVASDDGKYSWIRVKTWHLYEPVLWRTSSPVLIKELYTPEPKEGTAEDDFIDILSVTAGTDGASGIVKMGWNKNGRDDSTGTEVSWSKDEDAWRSTKEPSTYTFTWNEGKSGQYKSHAIIHIKDLEEGEKYYIRARRYREGTTGTTWGPYSSTVTVVTSEAPTAVALACDDFVASDKGLLVQWTFTGNAVQKEWQLISSTGAIISSGKGSLGATQVDASRLRTFATNNVATFTVKVSTGSGFVESNSKSVTILDAPNLSLEVAQNMTVQPFTFTATSNSMSDLVVIVYSQGVSGQMPTGLETQVAGDTIYSEVFSPVWENVYEEVTPQGDEDPSMLGWYEFDGEEYTPSTDSEVDEGKTYYVIDDEKEATVTLPTGLAFLDNGDYTVSVVAIDRTSGLKSAEVLRSFHVVWAHQAADIGDAVTVTPKTTIDDDNFKHIQAEITLTPPQGSAETDVYDIYRLVGGLPYLIGESFPLTFTATDEYAPFSNGEALFYRIALRTVDGDVSYTDIEYEHYSENMRFDWDGYALEFPYGISIGEKYAKNVQIRNHLDGTNDAYWNKNIEHKASLNTSVIRLVQPEEVTLSRMLARYSNAVFVRLPNGQAFEADVQVTDLSVKNKEVTAIAIDATEIGQTSSFILPPPNELEEEEE